MCRHCGTATSGTYCSNICQQAWQRAEKIRAWYAGTWTGNTKWELSKIIRDHLIKQADNRCVRCGWNSINPTTGTVPLQINHIDGNSENCRPHNLEVLCPNCHSLTPNYMALNKGSGRAFRYAALA